MPVTACVSNSSYKNIHWSCTVTIYRVLNLRHLRPQLQIGVGRRCQCWRGVTGICCDWFRSCVLRMSKYCGSFSDCYGGSITLLLEEMIQPLLSARYCSPWWKSQLPEVTWVTWYISQPFLLSIPETQKMNLPPFKRQTTRPKAPRLLDSPFGYLRRCLSPKTVVPGFSATWWFFRRSWGIAIGAFVPGLVTRGSSRVLPINFLV